MLPVPSVVARRTTFITVPVEPENPPKVTPSNFMVLPILVGSVTQKFRIDPDLETDSRAKFEEGMVSIPETALNGTLLVAITFTATRFPTSKLPEEGLTERAAASTMTGKAEMENTQRKNIIIFETLAIFSSTKECI